MTGAQHHLTGTLHVAGPPDEAFVHFTPRGEIAWAPGWEPRFAQPTDDDTAPGTVFETGAQGEPRPEAAAELDRFADGYAAYLREWEELIGAVSR